MKRAVDVHMEGEDRPIGLLLSDDQGVLTFGYSTDASRPLSLSLPVREEPYSDIEARIFFDNLLPEGTQIDNVIARQGLSRSDIAGLLFHLGKDCPGAISCVPKGEGPGKMPGRFDRDYEHLSDTDLGDIMISLRDNRRLPAETNDPSPLAGVQGKIAVTRMPDGSFSIPRTGSGAPTTHILKVPRAGEDALVDHEKVLMDIAGNAFTGEVAKTEALNINGVSGLLVSRFDRDVDETSIRRVHQEDFCQALGLPRALKYQKDGDGGRVFSAQAVQHVLSETVTPALTRSAFFEATLLNLALGNTDNHAKNHALLYRSERPVFAPLYDIVPILVDASVNHDFSFLIGSAQRHEELSEDDLYVLAVDLGMVVRSGSNQRMVKKTAMELCARVSCQIDECKGPRLKLVGDMIAHCLETMRDAFEFPVEVPERDAFLIQGGGFQLPS